VAISIKKRKMINNKKFIDHLITESLKKKKEENKEATGSGSAGGYSAPAFSMFADDDKARSEYKKPKKVEATEATGASSSGSYETPMFLAKDIKNWGPSKKTQIPGGSFVSVKEKCKTYPYCNQGDIKALDITKTAKTPKLTKRKSKISEAITNVSIKTGLTEEEIKKIILSVIDGNL
jgi:hypothetical protein